MHVTREPSKESTNVARSDAYIDFSLNPVDARPSRVAIIHEDNIIACTLRTVVTELFPRCVVSVYNAARDSISALRANAANLALIGLSLQDLDGLDLVEAVILERLAQKVCIVSQRKDECTLSFVRSANVAGFFDTQSEGINALPAAILGITRGQTYFSLSYQSSRCAAHKPPVAALLTPKELEVFVLMGGGADEYIVSEKLGIKKNTVHTHLEHIMRKLDIQTRGQLIIEAVTRGFVRMSSSRLMYPGNEQMLAKRDRSSTQRRSTFA